VVCSIRCNWLCKPVAPHTGCDPRSKAVKTNENTCASHFQKRGGSRTRDRPSFSDQCTATSRYSNFHLKGVTFGRVTRRHAYKNNRSSKELKHPRVRVRTDRMKDRERSLLPCDSSESERALYIRAKAAIQVARGELLI